MHMAKQEEIDTLQREKEYYQQHKGKKVSMRRKISHGNRYRIVAPAHTHPWPRPVRIYGRVTAWLPSCETVLF